VIKNVVNSYLRKPSFNDVEKIVFIVFLLWNASVLFTTKYFPTFDGGAHAYNTNIIRDLIFNKESVYRDYFQLNPEILPNWISYIILWMLRPIMPFYWAEKVLLLLFFIFVPLAFRSLVKMFNSTGGVLSYLIFPFTQFSLVYMGFFNFVIGVLFFLCSLRIYLKFKDTFDLKHILLLFICLGLVYFSHLFAFISILLFMMTHSGIYLILHFKELNHSLWKWILYRIINLLVPSLLFIIFTLMYFAKRPSLGNETFLPFEDLNSFILDATPLRVFGTGEIPYCKGIFYMIYALFVLTFYKRITKFKKEDGPLSFLKMNDTFLVCGLLFIYFVYTKPNEDGYVGMISIRIVYYMFIFMLLWIASNPLSNKIVLPLLVIYFFFFFKLFELKISGVKFLNAQFKKMEKPMKMVKPNSTMAQAYYADSYLWQGPHYVNYFGATNSVVVLGNYEADNNHFPVLWNEDRLPIIEIGDVSQEVSCNYWKSGRKSQVKKKADYFFIFGENATNDCYQRTMKALDYSYSLIYKEKDVRLYKLKNS
jgi:hypothetical protein